MASAVKYDFRFCVEHSPRLTNPAKTYRILEANGIKTWNDIVMMKKKDIASIKGIGPKITEVLYSMARKEESMNPQRYFKAKEI